HVPTAKAVTAAVRGVTLARVVAPRVRDREDVHRLRSLRQRPNRIRLVPFHPGPECRRARAPPPLPALAPGDGSARGDAAGPFGHGGSVQTGASPSSTTVASWFVIVVRSSRSACPGGDSRGAPFDTFTISVF